LIEVHLETPLLQVEQQLSALADAMKKDDPRALEAAAGELHRALAAAVDHFRRAARQGGVPSALRQRLAIASAQVAAQRESLARATAALDRAIDVLMPGVSADGYAAGGQALRSLHSGSAFA
jgi:ABC-type transporter Mla subunit MlaD